MTRHLTHALAALYTLLAVCLLRCAIVSQQNGRWDYSLFFSAVAAALGTATVHHAYHRAEVRAARAALERAARPIPDGRPLVDEVVAVALAAACCERWWTSAGATHDPDHCTRRDQSA
ncbi:hypothetical protein RM863_12695 [Streptomyces sp. DSM 41014]|uniref:Uncharacterized protein n=1 Tax=Streptomyces hintoniae TaxID=3075521 RepID=A0ABU2UI94_9ACTN|nr:hypothetical protein [Streptomyces sp. DSM 41014]MDT0472982.1 hypothetical protein [Streptomyces sp. DSM 41014]